jgi:hypothetical protein
VAYLATGLAAVPPLGASLLGLLELWQASTFCRERRRFRYQYGTLRAVLPRDEESQWAVEHESTRFIVKLITWRGAGQPGMPIDMIVTVVSHRSDEKFSELPDFEPQVTLLGSEALHQDPPALAELVSRLKLDGPPKWTPEIGEELARRTGLPLPAAALLWAGNTETNNALRVVVSPEARKALGLQVKQLDAASAALRSLYASTRKSDLTWWYNITGEPMPRQAFYDIYQQAMPEAPRALWTPLEGGEDSVVARLARAVQATIAPS